MTVFNVDIRKDISRRSCPVGKTQSNKDKGLLLAASEETQREKKQTICNAWNMAAFNDVSVYCGLDGGLVKTSRLFLSGLSQFLCKVFIDHNFVTKEETVVVLPDVNSKILADFLDQGPML
jgi:hypothetical protein